MSVHYEACYSQPFWQSAMTKPNIPRIGHHVIMTYKYTNLHHIAFTIAQWDSALSVLPVARVMIA